MQILTESELVDVNRLSPKVYFVSERKQKIFLEILRKRIKNGEDPYDILKIQHTETYYVNKLISGLCKATDRLYYRCTGYDPYISDGEYYQLDESLIKKMRRMLYESEKRNEN